MMIFFKLISLTSNIFDINAQSIVVGNVILTQKVKISEEHSQQKWPALRRNNEELHERIREYLSQ